MKVYVLIQEDRHYDTAVTVFADKEEAIHTASARIQPDVNRFRTKMKLSVMEIAELGAMTAQQILDHSGLLQSEREQFGVPGLAVHGDDPWIFYCCAYDDGPTFRVVETDLLK